MFTRVKGILKGRKIILEESSPHMDEQNILLTLLDQPTSKEKDLILVGIKNGLDNKENGNVLTFDESFPLLEKLVE